jgi:hypothetical protein
MAVDSFADNGCAPPRFSAHQRLCKRHSEPASFFAVARSNGPTITPRNVRRACSAQIVPAAGERDQRRKGFTPTPPLNTNSCKISKDLPPDRAWWVSHLVVRYEDHQFQLSKNRSTACRLDQSIDMAIQIPDTILRAAARTCSDYMESQK